jgi:hypothetical protein
MSVFYLYVLEISQFKKIKTIYICLSHLRHWFYLRKCAQFRDFQVTPSTEFDWTGARSFHRKNPIIGQHNHRKINRLENFSRKMSNVMGLVSLLTL